MTDIEKLDNIFSKYIRLRDSDNNGYVSCCTCDNKIYWKECDNGHFRKRRHLGTRYSEKNCNAQCKTCNGELQGNDEQYEIFLKNEYGEHIISMLTIESNQICKLSKPEIKEKIAYYKTEVKKLLSEKGLN